MTVLIHRSQSLFIISLMNRVSFENCEHTSYNFLSPDLSLASNKTEEVSKFHQFDFFFHRARGNRAYLLQMQSGKVLVYCHMTGIGLGACGGEGWTLVMKTDGHKVWLQSVGSESRQKYEHSPP